MAGKELSANLVYQCLASSSRMSAFSVIKSENQPLSLRPCLRSARNSGEYFLVLMKARIIFLEFRVGGGVKG